MNYTLSNAHIVDSDSEMKGSISIINGHITYLNQSASKQFSLDGSYFIYPSFVNAHDHLLGSYFPRIGTGNYANWLPWDNDLKSAAMYRERSLFTHEEIYLLGCLKHIMSGCVWVQDHIPHAVNRHLVPLMPIHIVNNITLAHEVSSYDLKWGDPKTEHEKAVKEGIPFVTHIAEGYDEEARNGVKYLKEYNALTDHTVLVHGLKLSDQDISDIAKAKAHLVWCPVSNHFMFNDIAPVKKWLDSKINVSLGTDSPASGGVNLLDEIQKACYLYEKAFKESLDTKILFDMITKNPSKALRIDAGHLKEGAKANIVITKKALNNPYDNIAKLKLADIALVIKDGVPLYGDATFSTLFSELNVKTFEVLVENEKKLLGLASVYKLLKKIKATVSYNKYLPFIPISTH